MMRITTGDGHGREVVIEMPRGTGRAARRLERAADPEDGIIQAWDVQSILPTADPTEHRTMHLSEALCIAGGRILPD